MSHTKGSRNWIGVILVLFGLLLLIDNFDLLYYITPDYYYPPIRLFSWPMIFLIVGAIILANNTRNVVGWIFLGLGGLNVASRFLHFSFRGFISEFWPLILIGIGLAMILKRRGNKTLHFGIHNTYNEHSSGFDKDMNNIKNDIHGAKEEVKSGMNEFRNEFKNDFKSGFRGDANTSEDPGDTIDVVSVFNSVKRRITSDNFKGGRITSIFGGSDIILHDAKLAEGEQVLDIVAIFGGVEIYVPRDWRVIVKTVTIFGGFEETRFRDSGTKMANDRVLVIKGFVLFGGGEVKN